MALAEIVHLREEITVCLSGVGNSRRASHNQSLVHVAQQFRTKFHILLCPISVAYCMGYFRCPAE